MKNKLTLSKILVFLMYCMGAFQLYFSSPVRMHFLLSTGIIPVHLHFEKLQIESMFFFMLATINLLFIQGLQKRTRLAWHVEFFVTLAELVHRIFKLTPVNCVLLLFDIFAIILFLIVRKNFMRKTTGFTLKGAIYISFILLGIIMVESLLTVILTLAYHNKNLSITETIYKSIAIIFGDTNEIISGAKHGFLYHYQQNLWIQALIVLVISTINILRPVLSTHSVSNFRETQTTTLRYGQNPLSYLTLEGDKKIFSGKKCCGVCGYQVVSGVFVICGDIISSDEDAETFLSEIKQYCEKENLLILMINTTAYFSSLYKKMGFDKIKFGEDACFCLKDYDLKGKKAAKVRAAVNHANKAGIVVEEYKPMEKRNPHIEKQIDDISNEWLIEKGGLTIAFTVGGVNFDNPMDRRYFYAKKDDVLLGFVVFLPYLNGQGYLADVTRRKKDAEQGVLEKIIVDAFMKMKNEGVAWGNMGLSPLYNITSENPTIPEKLLTKVYENLSIIYNFKSLHHSKEKFGPTGWENRYLHFSHNANIVRIMTALVRVQYPQNIVEIIRKSVLQK